MVEPRLARDWGPVLGATCCLPSLGCVLARVVRTWLTASFSNPVGDPEHQPPGQMGKRAAAWPVGIPAPSRPASLRYCAQDYFTEQHALLR